MPIDPSRALEAYVRAQTLPPPTADQPTAPPSRAPRAAEPAPVDADPDPDPDPDPADADPAEPQAGAGRPAPDVPPEPPGAPLPA